MNNKDSRVYFPSLNGIRAIAALLVIVHHIEQVKEVNGLNNFHEVPFIDKMGGLGVTLFFVLSGFLITYLLFVEQRVSNKIDVKKFYLRRILRIWPLYFLIIILSLLYNYYTVNEITQFFKIKLGLYLFFLPNVAYVLFSSGGFPSQLWSVGTEEQFYLIWPHIIKSKLKSPMFVLCGIVTIIVSIRFLAFLLNSKYQFNIIGIDLINFTWQFLDKFRIDYMALGAIGAYLYFNKEKYFKILNIIYLPQVQILNFILLLVLFFIKIDLGLFEHLLFSFFFLVLILNVATNKDSLLKLENSFLNFLGEISYGMYVYHPLVLIILIKISFYFKINSTQLFPFVYTILAFVLIVILSKMSYLYFEKPFLNLKKRYTKIVSGYDAKF